MGDVNMAGMDDPWMPDLPAHFHLTGLPGTDAFGGGSFATNALYGPDFQPHGNWQHEPLATCLIKDPHLSMVLINPRALAVEAKTATALGLRATTKTNGTNTCGNSFANFAKTRALPSSQRLWIRDNQAFDVSLDFNPNAAVSRPPSPPISQASKAQVLVDAAALAELDSALSGITSIPRCDLSPVPASSFGNLSQASWSRRPSMRSSFTHDSEELSQVTSQLRRQCPPVSMSNISSRPGSRRLSRTSSCSKDIGYTSASSRVDSDYSSATNASKKRKRQPKIEGGYKCSVEECGRVFDHDGERRKHEKIHSGDKPHVCVRCARAFYYPKDLQRHMKTHATDSKPVSPIMEPISDVEDLELEDVRLENAALQTNTVFAGSAPLAATVTPMMLLTGHQPADSNRSRHGIGKLTNRVAGLFGTGKKMSR